jgi:hypothetical protein
MALPGIRKMPRAARRYDIYLPLKFNDGRAVPPEHVSRVEARLLAQFGGVTSNQSELPLRGVWLGETRLFVDQVIVMTALDFARRGRAQYIAKLKQDLLHEFEQLEILITESSLRVH